MLWGNEKGKERTRDGGGRDIGDGAIINGFYYIYIYIYIFSSFLFHSVCVTKSWFCPSQDIGTAHVDSVSLFYDSDEEKNKILLIRKTKTHDSSRFNLIHTSRAWVILLLLA